MSPERIPPPFQEVTQEVTHVDGADSFTGSGSYHPPAARPNFLRRLWSRWARPALRVEVLPSSHAHGGDDRQLNEGLVRLSATTLETHDGDAWVVRCGVRYAEGRYWLEPVAHVTLTHNGAPLTRLTALASGDVVTTSGLTFRLLVGETAALSALTEAEAFAVELRVGLLSVNEGPGFRRARLRWRTAWAGSLTPFSRTALARSLTSLELVLRPCEGESSVDVENLCRLAAELGPLLAKTEFVVPSPVDAPPSLRVRVSAPVDVRFDGTLVALDEPARLVGGPEGLRVEARFAPAPALLTLGEGTFLSCEDGWGELECLGLPGADLVVTTENRAFLLPLLEGDEWLLTSKATAGRQSTVHRLTVHPHSGEQRARGSAASSQPEPLVFVGQAHRSVTLHLEARDVLFTQGSDGLFRGPLPRVFGVVGPGLLKQPRGEAGSVTMYDSLALDPQGPEAWAVLLPAPSGFLRGRTRLPAGPLTRGALEVFVDGLLDEGDGAAVALRSLLEAKGDRRQAECFTRLLLRPINRRKLGPWLRSQGDALNRFEEVPRVTSFEHARYLLDDALRTEPMFQRVRQLHVDVTPQRGDGGKAEYWLRLTRAGGWVPSVEVVCWRDGEVLERFVPRDG